MDKKKAHTEAGLKDKTFNKQDTSTSNQRNIILEALKKGPKTTNQLRYDYGIMQPAPRILELKARGNHIVTVKVDDLTPDGINHNRVAKYVLVQSKPVESANDSEVVQ